MLQPNILIHSAVFITIESVGLCPDEYSLMVPSCPLATHHAERTYFMGRAFSYRYDHGVQQVRSFSEKWDLAENYIDAERFKMYSHA